MCTLAVFFQISCNRPLVVAANRDEFYERPSFSPRRISENPMIWGGLDLRMGGTWLGINECGMFAAVLNRKAPKDDTQRRSRGLLCLDLLRAENPLGALEILERERVWDYRPFNLVFGDRFHAFVASFRGQPSVKVVANPLSPGLHMITNLDVDDPLCPKISSAQKAFTGLIPQMEESAPDVIASRLQSMLARHDLALDDREPSASLCVHTDSYGTRSSAVLIQERLEKNFHFFYCDQPPCKGEMAKLSLDLKV
jgi:uncharacterized protein with NRDE domain